MFRFTFHNQRPTTNAWILIIPGIKLLLFAIAIFIYPDLLAYLVAIMLATAGIGLLAAGYFIKKAQKRYDKANGYYEIPVR